MYRQCAVLADEHGIELSRKTLTDAILAAGAGASPSTVYRHAGIAVFLTFTAIMLLRDSRRLKA